MGTQKVIAQAILNKKADYILALKGNQSALHYYLGDWRFYQAMRLLSNGPDIPDELILGQEKEHTIFVCGAGVSQPVGLPLFRGLVEGVYQKLGEDWSLHLAECEG